LPYKHELKSNKNINCSKNQCFGSRSGLDPDLIRLEDPYPHPGGQKLPIKVEIIEISCFEVLDVLF
jgi:hypothetical protein